MKKNNWKIVHRGQDYIAISKNKNVMRKDAAVYEITDSKAIMILEDVLAENIQY